MSETTKLTTVEQVTAAIYELVNTRLHRAAFGPAGKTPQERREVTQREREEAARFADLYEMRAAQWHELGVRAFRVKSTPDVYGSACVVAEKHDRDQVRYWRNRASAR